MKRILTLIVILAGFGIAFYSCDKDNQCFEAPKTLSEWGFFSGNMADLQPAANILPYDLNAALFTDYAWKSRFVYIPSGLSATYTENGVLEFPEGSVLIKTFWYPNDFRDLSLGRKIIETRLLVRTCKGWEPANYIWNAAQTEATYSVVGRQFNQSWIHYDGTTKSANYLIPNQNECKGCHDLSGKFTPIGPKVRNLNKTYDYADGSMNQIEKWTSVGFLTGAPATPLLPSEPIWNDPLSGSLEDRTRGYLDINCAHCHNQYGPANNTGLFLNYENQDPVSLGICKTPIAAGNGAGNLRFAIVPGHPEQSIMIYRLSSVQPEIAMPELARSVVHAEGVQLISDWINTLTGTCN